MPEDCRKFLVVEPDPETLETLVSSLATRFDANITCVADAESCLDVELVDPHDIVVAEIELPDSDGLDLADKLLAINSRPVLLLADELTREDVLAAMRLGVKDIFAKPFPVEDLLYAADRALQGHELRRQRAVKYRRMRDLVRRVVRERRDLNRRMELVCRDLVGAHRRLVHRVLASEKDAPKTST